MSKRLWKHKYGTYRLIRKMFPKLSIYECMLRSFGKSDLTERFHIVYSSVDPLILKKDWNKYSKTHLGSRLLIKSLKRKKRIKDLNNLLSLSYG